MLKVWGLAAAACTAFTIILAAGVAPAAAQAGPTLDVQPTATTAGSTVTVSGQCPAGTGSPYVDGFLVVDETQARVEGFSGSIRPAANPDGTFNAPFPVPAETPSGTWRFRLSCAITDVSTGGPSLDVEVTSAAPVTLDVTADPTSVRAGEQLHITGSGCRAEGRALDRASVTVHRNSDDPAFPTPYVAVTSTLDAAGAWDVVLEVPADFPAGQAQLVVRCDDVQSQQPSWSRGLRAPVEVLPATDFPPSPVLPTTGGTAHGQLALGALGLIVGGAMTAIIARCRVAGQHSVD